MVFMIKTVMLILTTLVIAFAVAIAQAFVLGQLRLPGVMTDDWVLDQFPPI